MTLSLYGAKKTHVLTYLRSIMFYSVTIGFLRGKPEASRDTPGLKRTRIFELKSQQQI